MSIKKIYILLIINILIQKNIDAQSGWTRNQGGIFAKLGVAAVSGNKYYNEEGQLASTNVTFRQQALNFYGEYGITKNITGVVNFPLYKINGYSTTNTATGVGDPQVELKFALFKKIPVIAIFVGAEIPIAKQPNFATEKTPDPVSGLFNTINLPTGDSDFNYWTTLALSSGFGSTPGWGSIWGQYNRRSKGFSDQQKIGIEIGYKWTSKFWTNARLVGLYNGKIKGNAPISGITNGQSTEYSTLGVGAAYSFTKNWSLTFDFQTYTDLLVKRSNIYQTPFIQIGVSAEY
jgi:hypothetical protein